jgi:hypothetical protein
LLGYRTPADYPEKIAAEIRIASENLDNKLAVERGSLGNDKVSSRANLICRKSAIEELHKFSA